MKITLTGSEKAISVLGAYASVKNNTSVTVYASNKQGIDISSENVTPIQPNESAVIPDCNKVVYVMGTGEIAVESSNQPFNFFKPAPVSGGGGTGDGITLEQLNAALTPYETIANADRKLGGKVDVVEGYGLSQENYTSGEKRKLEELKSYDEATPTSAGLMSATDKTKLDGIWVDTYKEVLPRGTDINSVSTTGVYKIRNDYDIANIPSQNGGFLIVYQHDSGYSEQIFLEYYTNNMYTRQSVNAAWNEWAHYVLSNEIATTSAAGLMSAADKTKVDALWVGDNKEGLSNNTDLNAVKTTGFYKCLNGNTYLHEPTANGGILQVLCYDQTYVEQMYHEYLTRNIYVREMNESNWSEWRTLTTSDKLSLASPSKAGLMSAEDKAHLDDLWIDGTKDLIDSSIDINTLTETGVYRLDINKSNPSTPIDGGGILVVYCFRPTYSEQIFYHYPDNRVFVRQSTGGKWNDWAEIILSTGGTFTGDVNFGNNRVLGITKCQAPDWKNDIFNGTAFRISQSSSGVSGQYVDGNEHAYVISVDKANKMVTLQQKSEYFSSSNEYIGSQYDLSAPEASSNRLQNGVGLFKRFSEDGTAFNLSVTKRGTVTEANLGEPNLRWTNLYVDNIHCTNPPWAEQISALETRIAALEAKGQGGA